MLETRASSMEVAQLGLDPSLSLRMTCLKPELAPCELRNELIDVKPSWLSGRGGLHEHISTSPQHPAQEHWRGAPSLPPPHVETDLDALLARLSRMHRRRPMRLP